MIESALLCLALNLYHEGRGEPIEGQIAINLVVLNRVRINRSSVCREIHRPFQFSWTLKNPPVTNKRAFRRIYQISRNTLHIKDYTDGATHYHEVSVQPEWAKSLQYVGRWGNHLFYKEK